MTQEKHTLSAPYKITYRKGRKGARRVARRVLASLFSEPFTLFGSRSGLGSRNHCELNEFALVSLWNWLNSEQQRLRTTMLLQAHAEISPCMVVIAACFRLQLKVAPIRCLLSAVNMM
eukprot:6462281-Amphidinium_carterae.1